MCTTFGGPLAIAGRRFSFGTGKDRTSLVFHGRSNAFALEADRHGISLEPEAEARRGQE